jgi:uncharacterized phage-associated protein
MKTASEDDMNLAFDEVKATQCAAMFLKLAGRPLNYMALIKLLYKTDREALRRWGLPVTTDAYVSMKLGPVTSGIYDLIKSSESAITRPNFWSSHIVRSDGRYDVMLRVDPGTSELSPAEERLIVEVFEADGDKSGFALANASHRDFPEWKDPGNSSCPLEISDIITALGLSEEETAHVESSIGAQRAARNLAA